MIAMALTFVMAGESRTSLLVAPVLVIGAVTFAGRPHNRAKSLALFGVFALMVAGMILVIPSAREAVGRSYAAFSPDRTSLNVSSAIVDELAASCAVRLGWKP